MAHFESIATRFFCLSSTESAGQFAECGKVATGIFVVDILQHGVHNSSGFNIIVK